MANEKTLAAQEYLGQYGQIRKIIVNKEKLFARGADHAPSFSAYITFTRISEASLAILALDELALEERTLKASFGMTKYCSYFSKGIACPNKECLYLHTAANEADCYNKVFLKGRESLRKKHGQNRL